MHTAADALQLVEEGKLRKHMEATGMNSTSSRSHTVFVIKVSSGGRAATMTVVDLAGVEVRFVVNISYYWRLWIGQVCDLYALVLFGYLPAYQKGQRCLEHQWTQRQCQQGARKRAHWRGGDDQYDVDSFRPGVALLISQIKVPHNW